MDRCCPGRNNFVFWGFFTAIQVKSSNVECHRIGISGIQLRSDNRTGEGHKLANLKRLKPNGSKLRRALVLPINLRNEPNSEWMRVHDLSNGTSKPFLSRFCIPGEPVETITSRFPDGWATIAFQLHSHCCTFVTGMSILEFGKPGS
jgi:hypothetical protein